MIRGGLFARFFLEDGIRVMPEYARLDTGAVAAFAVEIRRHWQALDEMPRPSEAETEAVFIPPILERLGWEHLPQQEPGRGRRDIADALLFVDPQTAARARPLPSADRFRLGAVVVENEAKDRPHDPAWRADVREAGLRLLYRLLFLLYAEDRDLLPVRRDAYREYGLQQLRDMAAEAVDRKRICRRA